MRTKKSSIDALSEIRMQIETGQKGLNELKMHRDIAISQAVSDGVPVTVVANTVGVSRNTIYKVLDELAKMGGNVELNQYTTSRIKTTNPLHVPQRLTESQRERFRLIAIEAASRKRAGIKEGFDGNIQAINVPRFDPNVLMPILPSNGLTCLSLFSGGGGLDLGFDRAGFTHKGSWELLDFAARTLQINRPEWDVHGGNQGDVSKVNWRQYSGNIDVVHGGPPCQPFSNAGRQRGQDDPRNMWPEFIRAIDEVQPRAFVAENVAALGSATFSEYVQTKILDPLEKNYTVFVQTIQAYEHGTPQLRKRVFFFGFHKDEEITVFEPPRPKYCRPGQIEIGVPESWTLRNALGLPDIGVDDLSPTIRSALGGPRNTTSILSSTSAQKKFEALGIWPNGVARDRFAAANFPTKNGTFRLSVQDVSLMQGFPEDWHFNGAVYQTLGQIGNSVSPPVAYSVANSVAEALSK